MKKLIFALALGLFVFMGTANQVEARPYGGGHGYHQNAGQIYFSHYKHGRPVYKQRYVAGYKRCGTPIFRVRYVSAPRGNYNRCGSGYRNRREFRQDRRRYGRDRRSNRGSRITFRF